MRFQRDPDAAGPIVTGFTANGFVCGEVAYPEGLLLTPEKAQSWSPEEVGRLAVADFDRLLALSPAPEFLVLGTGPSLVRPAPALTAAIEARGVGLEVMDSRAAARAWGILRSEGRWIAAALMPLA